MKDTATKSATSQICKTLQAMPFDNIRFITVRQNLYQTKKEFL